MRLDESLDGVQEVVIDENEGLPERNAGRPERRQSHRSNQEDRGDYRQGTLSNHTNSFSFFRPSYNEATNAP
jgi:hypothetical protein